MDIETAMNSLIHIGGNELALRVSELYQGLVPERLSVLLQYSPESDLIDIARLAHNIKSSAGNLGLQAVYDSAQAIESKAFNNSPESLKVDIQQLEADITQSLIDLKNWKQNLKPC